MPKYKRVSLFARIHACMHTYITHKHTYTRLASMCNDDVHATMHARAAHSLSRASTHAAPKRCYRYRAPGCRARSFHRQRAALAHTHTHIHTYTLTHTHTHVRVRVQIFSHRCERPWYIPAPGTNIIACRDKFIAAVPQPLANVPRLRRKMHVRRGTTLETPTGRERRGGGRSESRSWALVRGIYPSAGITRYTRCPGDNSDRASSNIMHERKLRRKIVSRGRRAKMHIAYDLVLNERG